MTYDPPPKKYDGSDDRNDPEPNRVPDDPEDSGDDLVNRVYGPSQEDMDKSWEEYETGAVQRRSGPGGAFWKYLVIVVSLVILVSLALGTIGPIFDGPRSVDTVQRTRPELVAVSVLRVIDAKTIVVRSGAGEQTVRLIGIASPVFGDSWHDFARRVSQSWIEGEEVLLESDERDADEQGRLLRYVYFDNVMINAALIINGLGRAEPESPNTRYNLFLADLERQAKEAGAGIWAPVPGTEASSRNSEASLRPGAYAGPLAS